MDSAPSGRLDTCLFDLMHLPAGFLLMGFLNALIPQTFGRYKRVLFASTLLLTCAALVEWVQPRIGREADFLDGVYTCLGGLIFICIWAARATGNHAQRTAAILGACGCVMLASLPCISVLLDEHRLTNSFPLLAGFECPGELTRWSTSSCRMTRARRHATQGSYAGCVVVEDPPGAYPGVFLNHLIADWERSDKLTFDAFWAQGRSGKLWIRLDDKEEMPVYSQRFQVMVVLTQGMNHIQICRSDYERTSGGRMLDLSKVARLGLFWDAPVPGDMLYVDNIRLIEKDTR